MATFRYEQLHQQQLLNWGLEERGRFSSYRGLLSVRTSPSFILSFIPSLLSSK
jgi:hypothetical protein